MENFKASFLFGTFVFAMVLLISSHVAAHELTQQEHDNELGNSNRKQNIDGEDFSIGLHFGPGDIGGGQGGISGRRRGGYGGIGGYGRGYGGIGGRGGGGYGGIGGYGRGNGGIGGRGGGGYGGIGGGTYGRRYGGIGYGRGPYGLGGRGVFPQF